MKFAIHIIFPVIVLLVSHVSPAKAGIITVKQDGTGDYATIQQGINAAAFNTGDTVLVWPGIYDENISFNAKAITVASLYITTQDKWYINNTLIDGNHDGHCVKMTSGVDTQVINGFTIRNGSAETGGGIYTNETTAAIKNCIIEHNFSSKSGGGIFCWETEAWLEGTTLRHNHAAGGGGGIVIMLNSVLTFDTLNKCNIYMNYGPNGSDIGKSPYAPDQTVYLDTLTVLNPDYHFVSSSDEYLYPQDDIELHVDHGFLQPVDHDLYVNPVTGDDSNSGTGPDDPLKTIAFAYMLIKSDSLNPHTIYLASGVYSPSTNGEKLTLGTRNYISLIGENRNSTIIDGDSTFWLMRGLGLMRNYSIENITFQHGRNGIYIERNNNVSIKM